MRVEPYTVGSYMHIIKRGGRGLDIVRDDDDKWRFLKSLYYLNDTHFDKNWMLSTKNKGMFYRPAHWPEQNRLVSILAYTLMPNHFHLIIKEIQEGGVSLFMQKLGQSMTNYTNLKYNEKGSLFQGSFRSKTCDGDVYLRYLSTYVMVKNTFELYPNGGLSEATNNFEDAWKWATRYPFSSLKDFSSRENSPVFSMGILKEMFTKDVFKTYAQDVILSGKWSHEEKELE